MPTRGADTGKFGGYLRSCSAPVYKISSNKHVCGLSIVRYVRAVRGAVFLAMMRIFLDPSVSFAVPMINIVVVCLLQTALKVRFLVPESRVGPIGGIIQDLVYLHRVN